ncbi:MAG: voltage-gated potassium channel [Mariniblastus sp.]|jgi:voltage-gated potassium channel
MNSTATHLTQPSSFANPMVMRIFKCTILLFGILIVGTFGYMMIEGWNTEDGFYMTVITLATVGYGETQELSGGGRLFTILLIFTSIICLSCWTACLTSLFVEGDLSGAFNQKKAKKMARQLSNHSIICGSGTMALTVLDILSRKQTDVVLIDNDVEQLKIIRRRYPDLPIIESSAIDEMSLANANILEAACVIASLDSDFDNLMIAMTCKDLGTDVKIIARSDDMHVASRLMKLGVDKVICPFQISGVEAAEFAMQK